jgi:glucose-1-phosphate cytidylyltransferase
MDVVILCGGSGTRLREQTEFLPKPMIKIGPYPMVVHIMKLFSHYGFNDFILALGYKQEVFTEYFSHYNIINADLTLYTGRFQGNPYQRYMPIDDWQITLSDTGLNTMKGGRLKRVEKYIHGDTFMLTYGDSIGDINIPELLSFHESHGKIATVTGVHATPRFGEIHHDSGRVLSFSEKPQNGDTLINGGFFVFNRGIFKYLSDDECCDLEVGTLELIANKGEMMVYQHRGYWGCMDSLKEMNDLNNLWEKGLAKWRVW